MHERWLGCSFALRVQTSDRTYVRFPLSVAAILSVSSYWSIAGLEDEVGCQVCAMAFKPASSIHIHGHC